MSKKLLFLLALAACSSEAAPDAAKDKGPTPHPDPAANSPVAPAGASDAGPPAHDAAQDGLPPPNTYAKFLPAPPQLTSSGGRLLASPKFQAITFAGDPLQGQIDAFTEKIGQSAYWAATTKEYGISAGTALPPVHISDPPPSSLDDEDIKAWLRDVLDQQSADFVQPDENTLYVVYFPPGVTVTQQKQASCQYFGGYHDEIQTSAGQAVSYAVVPRCAHFNGLTGIDAVTGTASHEMFEATTDALPETNPAYDHVDDDHFVWSYTFLPEGADLCVQSEMLGTRPPEIGFFVQRTWSNLWAKAGHHPCVPGVGATYFNAAPVLPDTVTVNAYQGQLTVTTRGIKIPVGASKTIDVQLFSDGPTADWDVTAIDWRGLRYGDVQELAFTLDRKSGNNGDVLKLTIKALRPATDGLSAFVLQSRSGSQINLWPGLVANN